MPHIHSPLCFHVSTKWINPNLLDSGLIPQLLQFTTPLILWLRFLLHTPKPMRAWATLGSGLFPELETMERVVLFPTFPYNKAYFIFKCPNPHVFKEMIFGSYFEIISNLSSFCCHLTVFLYSLLSFPNK